MKRKRQDIENVQDNKNLVDILLYLMLLADTTNLLEFITISLYTKILRINRLLNDHFGNKSTNINIQTINNLVNISKILKLSNFRCMEIHDHFNNNFNNHYRNNTKNFENIKDITDESIKQPIIRLMESPITKIDNKELEKWINDTSTYSSILDHICFLDNDNTNYEAGYIWYINIDIETINDKRLIMYDILDPSLKHEIDGYIFQFGKNNSPHSSNIINFRNNITRLTKRSDIIVKSISIDTSIYRHYKFSKLDKNTLKYFCSIPPIQKSWIKNDILEDRHDRVTTEELQQIMMDHTNDYFMKIFNNQNKSPLSDKIKKLLNFLSFKPKSSK
jgi:hypothetical protein